MGNEPVTAIGAYAFQDGVMIVFLKKRHLSVDDYVAFAYCGNWGSVNIDWEIGSLCLLRLQ